MDLQDYLIEQSGLDWSRLLSHWHWILPQDFVLWFVNRFGDLFIEVSDGSINWLDIGRGELSRVAEGRDDFARLLDESEHANDWLMIPLVDKLVQAGMRLEPGKCYSYCKLPIFGGDYTVDNVVIKSLEFHYNAFGPIHEKIKDLPDGTVVKFNVDD
jgi:hypothetical protein